MVVDCDLCLVVCVCDFMCCGFVFCVISWWVLGYVLFVGWLLFVYCWLVSGVFGCCVFVGIALLCGAGLTV